MPDPNRDDFFGRVDWLQWIALTVFVALAALIITFIGAYATPLRAAPPAGSNYSDSATSQWFKGLVTQNDQGQDIGCCDQSDCRETKATIGADGVWTAESRLFPGENIRVPERSVLKQENPLMNAVLCETSGGYGPFRVTTSGGKTDFIYCFVPPPQGF
jgi:hypothetical protein